MRVLLTGASGFLGRHVLALLQQRGVQTWSLGRSCPPSLPVAAHLACDLLSGADLAVALRQLAPSHLLHLAWVTDYANYQVSPRNAHWMQATQRLAQAFCDAGGRHMVVAGSCAEYDWSGGWCDEETTALTPATAYGAAKDATRRWLQAHCAASGVRLAWGRIFFPFGAGQSPQRLIPSLVAALRGERDVFAVQALHRRDFVAAPDVAGALCTLLQSCAGGCFNISSADPVAVGDLVRMLAQLLDADPAPLLDMAARELQPPALVAGSNRSLCAIGWSGPTPLIDGLAQMVHGVGTTPASPPELAADGP